MKFALPICAAAFLVGAARADPWVDDSLSCPMKVEFCPVICVNDPWAECPPEMQCPEGQHVCTDGYCYDDDPNEPFTALPEDFFSCYEASENNPCYDNCHFYQPCPRNVATDVSVDACNAKFEADPSGFYSNDRLSSDINLCDPYIYKAVPYDSSGFIVFWLTFSFTCVSGLAFCFFNQRLSPVGEVKPLEDLTSGSDIPNLDKEWTQTAYKTNVVGDLIYYLVVAGLWGFQFILGVTTICYYLILDEQPIGTWNLFEDYKQAMFVFSVAWMIGIVYSLILKWPSNIASLFLRRCEFPDANYVAVFAKAETKNLVVSDTGTSGALKYLIETILITCDNVIAAIFSDVTRRTDIRGNFTYCPVTTDGQGTKTFYFRLRRYIYDAKLEGYRPGNVIVGVTFSDLIACKNGLNTAELEAREAVVGLNIIKAEAPSFLRTVRIEFNKAFYLYQNYMCWVWMNFDYWHMGFLNTIVFISGGLSICVVDYTASLRLHSLGFVTGTCEVLRNNNFQTVQQTDLIPGDVVRLAAGTTYCDMVLLKGSQVLVDESSLTGESMPVVKSALDETMANEVYNFKKHSKSTVSAGTTVLEGNAGDAKPLAVVMKTGSFTTKGELLRDILFAEQQKFKFDVDVEVVILILFFYAIAGFIIVNIFLAADPVYAWFYGMYVVASALPPLLPTVFVVSVGISASRLYSKRVVCSDTHRILMAGKVSIAFFDKTGTLTKQGMNFLHSLPVVGGAFGAPGASNPAIKMAMSTCHNVTKINRSGADLFVGNSVDVMMFQSSKATITHYEGQADVIVESGSDGKTFKIVKSFDFDHSRMAMSVVLVEQGSNTMHLITKGSSESIRKLCKDETVPADFGRVVDNSARMGIYQLSVGTKIISGLSEDQVKSMTRDELECDLNCVGFINFKNSLKEDTAGVLQQLKEGDVKTVMVSGDNVLTAYNIAKESGMVERTGKIVMGRTLKSNGQIDWTDGDSDVPSALPSIDELKRKDCDVDLALTGECWRSLSPAKQTEIGPFVRIFGRCTPADKVSIVQNSINMGMITLMCGDGGNDCGALKAAHIGVALSDSEASVVSPFTSLDKTCSSVVDILMEGRCTLSSAFSSYKYMIMYGQVQTINQTINAWFAITFSEWCWVFMDGIWLLPMAFVLTLPNVAKKLYPIRPTSSLLGWETVGSVMGVLCINNIATVVAMALLFEQDFYQCRQWEPDGIGNVLVIGDNYETSTLFLVSGWQYVCSGFAYSFGYKHRSSWYSNPGLVFICICFTIIHLYITLVPSQLSCVFRVNCGNENIVRGAVTDVPTPIGNLWHTTVMPMDFRIMLAVVMIANTVLIVLWEIVVMNGSIGARFRSKKARFGREMTFEEGPQMFKGESFGKTPLMDVKVSDYGDL